MEEHTITKKKILVLDRDFDCNRRIRFLEEKHEVIKTTSQTGLLNFKEKFEQDFGFKNGLEYFDMIIMEPYWDPFPMFGYEETDEATQTGYFLYKKIMEDLPDTKVVIWTHPVEQYNYPNSWPKRYPNRSWGKNMVGFAHKNPDDDSMLQIVEKYFSN